MADAAQIERIKHVRPDLDVRTLRTGEDGLVNEVLIVNEEWVFRFARSAEAQKALERELEVLDRIHKYISVQVPRAEYRGPGWMAYRLIPGGPLTRHELLAQKLQVREAVLNQLADFLAELHGLAALFGDGPPATTGAAALEDSTRLFQLLDRELFPLMMAHARAWAIDHFKPVVEGRLDLSYSPALIHGDLMPYHLCYAPGTDRLNGVVDFGDARIGDPALDIASLIIAFGESLVWHLVRGYPGLHSSIDRARFYAGALELRWALQAVRSRDPAWFLCHLGYGRDMLPILTPSSSSP